MTVGEMRERMSNAEFHDWAAYYKAEAQMNELRAIQMEQARG
jgi:hypothetical protein